jgi:hypothetical protein
MPKEYYGVPASEGHNVNVTWRLRGSRPLPIAKHLTKTVDPVFDWGHEGASAKNLARSLLLNAFGTLTECKRKVCKCANDWVDTGTVDYITKEVVATLRQGDTFKINQMILCDTVFEYRKFKQMEESIDTIELPDIQELV